nr:MAG TPA: hypothetical protein [Caudoviricetes sp.]
MSLLFVMAIFLSPFKMYDISLASDSVVTRRLLLFFPADIM